MINAILQAPKTHLNRIIEFLSIQFGIKSSLLNNCILIQDVNPQFIFNIIKSSILRIYIDRVYFYQYETNNYDEIINYTSNVKNVKLRVQAFPKNLEEKLVNDLKNVILNPKEFDYFLSVFNHNGKYYYGLFAKELFYRKQAENISPISRAYYKIEEVIKRFNIELNKSICVLDIGAAPGGWTQYLSDKVKRVIAVDPGHLEISSENVIHINKKIEESIPEIENLSPYELVVCDVNADPQEVAKIINTISNLISKDGILIMTLKLVLKGKRGKKTLVEETKKILEEKFSNIKIVWLLANSKYERTLIATKKS